MRDSTAEVDGPGGAAEHVLHTAGVLGITEDVTTSGLLLHARRIGMGASPAVAGVVRQQAVADSKELQAALQQVWRCPPCCDKPIVLATGHATFPVVCMHVFVAIHNTPPLRCKPPATSSMHVPLHPIQPMELKAIQ